MHARGGPQTCSYERPVLLRDYYRRRCLGGRDDFTQPTYSRRWHTALCGHCSPGPGSMAAMRPALRYTPLKPRRTGLLPRHWGRIFHVRDSRGRYSDGSMCGWMEECGMEEGERVVSGRQP
jgi:hypothetical protein